MNQIPLLPASCFFLTGLSALVCEVCWIRKSSLVFGNSVWAMSMLLAVFFVGLALGSYVVGKYSRQVLSPLRGYALLEFGVGVLAILSPWLFDLAELVFSWIYPAVYKSLWQLTLVRVLLVSCLLLPAATLMGGSLPLFCQQFLRNPNSTAGVVGLLYGINTLGAATGAAICGFWMIPHIGITTSLIVAGCINILVGVAALRVAALLSLGQTELPQFSSWASRAEVRAESEGRSSVALPKISIVETLFFGIGFNAMACEVLWARYLSLWLPNTVHTYTLTLSVVLVGIVSGSLFSALFADRLRRKITWLGLAQVLSGWATIGIMQLRPQWWGDWFNAVTIHDQLLVVTLVMFIPSMLSGMCFPLAVSLLIRDAEDSGAAVGKMTALNLLGGVLGSLFMGFCALPLLGLHKSLWVITAVGMWLGIIAWWSKNAGLHVGIRVVGTAAAILVWLGIPSYFQTKLPESFLETEGTLVDFREGVNANVSVIRKGEQLHLEINRMWQGQNVKNHQPFAAHIPALLHGDPESVLVIGLGTGQTASSFLAHDIGRLDIAEIEDGLIQLVRQHFDGQWMDDSRVRIIIEDGRNYVAHTSQQYDIVSIEVGQIYRPGIAAFYTQDFYERVLHKTTDGGLVCQFLPIEFFRLAEFQTLLATFCKVFPECVLWYNTSELLLIGAVGSKLTIDLPEIQRKQELNTQLAKEMEFAYWAGPSYHLSRTDAWMAGFLCGPSQVAKLSTGGTLYQDDRPFLEYLPLNRQTQVPEIVSLIRRNLAPITSLTQATAANWQLTAERIRVENLQEIQARIAFNAAQQLEASGAAEEALAAYQEAVAILPTYPKANVRLAEIMRAQGQLSSAQSYYKRAFVAHPKDTSVLQGLSEVSIELGQHGEAIPVLQQLVGIQPNNGSAHALLGWAYGEQGQNDKAIKCFEAALSLDPNATRAHLGLAKVLQATGDLAAAEKIYKMELGKDPSIRVARLALAVAQQQDGKFTEALDNYRVLLPSDPNSPTILSSMAMILATHPDRRMRNPTQALSMAQQAWEITQQRVPEVGASLAAAYAAENRFGDALAVLDISLQEAEGSNLIELVNRLKLQRELYKQNRTE